MTLRMRTRRLVSPAGWSSPTLSYMSQDLTSRSVLDHEVSEGVEEQMRDSGRALRPQVANRGALRDGLRQAQERPGPTLPRLQRCNL